MVKLKHSILTILILCISLLGPLSPSRSQSTSQSSGLFNLDTAKVNLNYTAQSKTGFKFNWNSDHLGKDLNNPLKYTYKTDFGLGLNKYSKLSMYTEESSLTRTASVLNPVKSNNFGLNFGYTHKYLGVNIQYSYKQLQNRDLDQKVLKLDLNSRF